MLRARARHPHRAPPPRAQAPAKHTLLACSIPSSTSWRSSSTSDRRQGLTAWPVAVSSSRYLQRAGWASTSRTPPRARNRGIGPAHTGVRHTHCLPSCMVARGGGECARRPQARPQPGPAPSSRRPCSSGSQPPSASCPHRTAPSPAAHTPLLALFPSKEATSLPAFGGTIMASHCCIQAIEAAGTTYPYTNASQDPWRSAHSPLFRRLQQEPPCRCTHRRTRACTRTHSRTFTNEEATLEVTVSGSTAGIGEAE